ncbi:uncharacterized protein Tco025E_08172 [Trypanosoma conorhini]|uniref:Uncharacterized protein n=1 Tax=Trypanosoma conorhini TaxID=83891 RepID=A0A3R7NJA9_9TRYP|nr:uncharacterized protein Tco025E_08172 [Trypanosoma conorhini]RNF03440.1 hypothetical protein Tco025E_08172 [Trypanosoma conorhini]
MVLLTVKGTTFPDEFTVACTATTAIDAALAQRLCRIQNVRHQLKLQLLSARELLAEVRRRRPPKSPGGTGDDDDGEAALAAAYERLIEATSRRLRDAAAPVTPEEFDAAAEELRGMTERLYPDECCVPAGGRDAAVERLYALHETPELDEERRLVVYHCRAVLDRQWKQHELQREDGAGLWFCGKLMEGGSLARYSGRNEKSRLTVKVHPKDGPAPSAEPRMSYDDQRVLFARMRQRREEYKTLEDSELRARVAAQTRGRVVVDAASLPTAAAVTVDTARLRPIRPQTEERDVT